MFENYKDCIFHDKTILKKNTEYLKVTIMMIRDYKNLIKVQRNHMGQMR